MTSRFIARLRGNRPRARRAANAVPFPFHDRLFLMLALLAGMPAGYAAPAPSAGDTVSPAAVSPAAVSPARSADPGTAQPASSPVHRVALDDLSLRNAVGIAIARHPDISRAGAEVAQRSSEVEVAKAAWYPKIEYGVRPGYGGSFGSSGNSTGARASVGINQLLYDFGRTSSRIAAADATLNQKQYQFADTVENVADSTAATFVELAASQDVIAAARRQVAALRETRVKIVDRVRAGLSVSSDRNLADLAILRAEAEVLKANTRFDVAAAKLTELIGARPQRVAGLAGTVDFVSGLGDSGEDIEHTPSVLAAGAAVQAADARVGFAEAERFPSLGIGVSRAVSTGRANASNDTWIGLSLSGSFSFGNLAKHQIAAARADQRASRESLENQRLVTRSALHAARTEGRRRRRAPGKLSERHHARARLARSLLAGIHAQQTHAHRCPHPGARHLPIRGRMDQRQRRQRARPDQGLRRGRHPGGPAARTGRRPP